MDGPSLPFGERRMMTFPRHAGNCRGPLACRLPPRGLVSVLWGSRRLVRGKGKWGGERAENLDWKSPPQSKGMVGTVGSPYPQTFAIAGSQGLSCFHPLSLQKILVIKQMVVPREE